MTFTTPPTWKTGTTTPLSPANLQIFSDDLNDLNSRLTALQAVPTGGIIRYAGSSLPTNYLWCDGSAVSRTTYATLFGIIGTAFGAGDGSTTFNLPDIRSRTILGFNPGQAGAPALGAGLTSRPTRDSRGGAETVQLDASTTPSHSHTATDSGHGHTASQTSHTHTYSDAGHGHTPTDPGHTHTSYIAQFSQVSGAGGITVATSGTGGSATGNNMDPTSPNTQTLRITINTGTAAVTVANAQPAVTINSSTAVLTQAAMSAATAHNNMQPFVACGFIIHT